MRLSVTLFSICLIFCTIRAQEPVSFRAADGSKVNARLYRQNSNFPFILLFHERESSEEHSRLAARLLNLNFNCLLVPVRNSGSGKEIDAAIAFSESIGNSQIVLFGSTRCASLCLASAGKYRNIRAIIALSPGEYFQPVVRISDAVKELTQPVFVASSPREYPYIQQMFAGADSNNVTLFMAGKNSDFHGSALLSESNPAGNEYWFALTMFFRKLDK